MNVRNLTVLLLCQLISATGAFVLVTVGGIVGTTLAPSAALATLPVSLMVVGIALTTIPAAMLMQRIGRKAGFALSSLFSVFALLLAAWAVHSQSFWMFGLAALLLGCNGAFTQQYRFAAVESVDERHAGRAVSVVLLGAIGGAFLGQQLIRLGSQVGEISFVGTFLWVAALYFLQSLLMLGLGPLNSQQTASGTAAPRSLRQLTRQPVFVVAVISGTAAYGVMSFIMTATPISMHIHDGFSIAETATVIRNHVLAMYLPSLVSGYLLDRFGTVRIMAIGTLALMLACLIGYVDHSYVHYTGALVLLGVGWNFLFVGATTTLTRTYRSAERFKAQALNDFSVFGMSAAGSFLAGAVLHSFGWQPLIISPLLLLLGVLFGLYIVRLNPLVRKSADVRGVAPTFRSLN